MAGLYGSHWGFMLDFHSCADGTLCILLCRGFAGKISLQIQQLYGAIVADAPKAGIGILMTDKASCLALL